MIVYVYYTIRYTLVQFVKKCFSKRPTDFDEPDYSVWLVRAWAKFHDFAFNQWLETLHLLTPDTDLVRGAWERQDAAVRVPRHGRRLTVAHRGFSWINLEKKAHKFHFLSTRSTSLPLTYSHTWWIDGRRCTVGWSNRIRIQIAHRYRTFPHQPRENIPLTNSSEQP